MAIHNRPGLSALAYRSGTWRQFKESMLAALTGSAHPALAELATRADDDFTIALLDAVAVVGDVLTFYQERLVNEQYLHTATERISVLELARLIGYELKPGVAAETLLSFTVDDAAGAPGVATLDAGVKVQSVPGHDEKPQMFETVETLEARVEWNAMRPRQTMVQDPATMSAGVWLAGIGTDLRVGDLLLLVGPEREASSADERWDARFVTDVRPDFEANRTQVLLGAQAGGVESGSGPSSAPRAYAMRVRASAFGANAADWKTLSVEFRKAYLGISDDKTARETTQWPEFFAVTNVSLQPAPAKQASAISSRQAVATNTFAGIDGISMQLFRPTLDLDLAYSGVQGGTWMVLATPQRMELYRVTTAMTTSRAEFGLSGKTTRVTLSGENSDLFDDVVRSLNVFGHSQELILAESPIVPGVTGIVSTLTVEGDVMALPAGRTLLLQGLRAADGIAATESVLLDHTESAGAYTRLVLTTALANSYLLDGLRILGNVVRATHGETVAEVLGAGNAAVPYQRMALRQGPVTMVRNGTSSSGTASTLGLRVNDVLWTEVPDFHLRAPTEQVYVARRNDAGDTVVHFGDGVHGSRLPTGVENIRATYRKGVGLGGNVRAGQLSTLLTRPLGLKSAINPQPATGGDDVELQANARENAPIMVLTLGRAVSLQDYADFSRGYAGIAKSLATWSWDGERRGMMVTVAAPEGGDVSDDVIDLLTSALRAAGDPFVPLRVVSYRSALFRVSFKLRCDPRYDRAIVVADVVDALRSEYAFAARAFGEPVALSGVIATIQNVPGVIAVDIDQLRRTDNVGGSGLLAPLPAAMPQAGALASTLAAELLTLADDPIVPGDMP